MIRIRLALLGIIAAALLCAGPANAAPRMHAPAHPHYAAPDLSLSLALRATRYMLRSNDQIGARWLTAPHRRIVLDRRISRTRVRFLFELPGIEGTATVRTWPNQEISVNLHWER